MRNLLNSSICKNFRPTFDNRECEYYQYAEDDKMNVVMGECGYCKRHNCYRCIADVTRTIPLSHSSSNTFDYCHYAYMLSKIMGIQTKPKHMSVAVKAGKLWDTVKQKYLGGDVNINQIIKEYEIDEITVAKVRGLFHAYKELEIVVDAGYELQAEIQLEYQVKINPSKFIPTFNIGEKSIPMWENNNQDYTFPLYITGFYDRKYENYFTEDKLTGKPEFYLDPFYIQSQCGTYFLADSKLEYVIMEVVQMPYPKIKDGESADNVYKKVYDDVLSRPSKYFIGWDREKRKYGKKFLRNEFDLESIKQRYEQMIVEVMAARWSGNFYKNFKSCNNLYPGIPCGFQGVCKSGVMSDEIYEIRRK